MRKSLLPRHWIRRTPHGSSSGGRLLGQPNTKHLSPAFQPCNDSAHTWASLKGRTRITSPNPPTLSGPYALSFLWTSTIAPKVVTVPMVRRGLEAARGQNCIGAVERSSTLRD